MIYFKKSTGTYSAAVQLGGERYELGEYASEALASQGIEVFKANKLENPIEKLMARAADLRQAVMLANDELAATLKACSHLPEIIPPSYYHSCGSRMQQLPNGALRCNVCNRDCPASEATFRGVQTPSMRIEFTTEQRALIAARKSACERMEQDLAEVHRAIGRARNDFFRRCRFGPPKDNDNAE